MHAYQRRTRRKYVRVGSYAASMPRKVPRRYARKRHRFRSMSEGKKRGLIYMQCVGTRRASKSCGRDLMQPAASKTRSHCHGTCWLAKPNHLHHRCNSTPGANCAKTVTVRLAQATAITAKPRCPDMVHRTSALAWRLLSSPSTFPTSATQLAATVPALRMFQPTGCSIEGVDAYASIFLSQHSQRCAAHACAERRAVRL
ncbi:hypothetical protein XHV734_0874 [Xanthomonas hortorum pv. vitians]|nr:hypothetical protein XHV734_0874 [Xanthomonas hortorum pv. vitians]